MSESGIITNMNNKEFISVEDLSKSFYQTKALLNINISFENSQIHAIVGENGAGKTTLVSILAGVHTPDSGRIYLEGNEIEINSPDKAKIYGISLVPQEISCYDNLTVAENIFINSQPTNKLGLIESRRLFADSKRLLDSFGLDLKANAKIKFLDLATKQIIAILSKVSSKSRVLILDEPTSAMSEKEVSILFDLLNKLKSGRVCIIYVSHRLPEVFEIADKISVLRNGSLVGTKIKKETNPGEIISMMVGREIGNIYLKREKITGKNRGVPLLEVKKFEGEEFRDVNLKLYSGEILSLAGLAGDGRKEFIKALFGILKNKGGEIYIRGIKKRINSPLDSIKEGMGYMPDDRKEKGLFLRMTVARNIIAVNNEDFSGFNFVSEKREKYKAKDYVEKLDVKTPSIETLAENLSGGNQQKLLLAKWLAARPDILLVDEPTRGVDVGAKAEIYEILNNIINEGVGILLVSSDLPEIIGISNRIIIFHREKIAKEIDNINVAEQDIMSIASYGGDFNE